MDQLSYTQGRVLPRTGGQNGFASVAVGGAGVKVKGWGLEMGMPS